MVEKFPLIELEGNAKEIGLQHGKLLKDRIHKTIEFYTDVTKNLNNEERKENEKIILEQAKHFKKVIKKFNKNFAKEIEAIAEAAEVDPLWIYAINSRSEIMTNMNMGSTECTTLYFKNVLALGQNWDWTKDLEELVVIMKIKLSNGVTILQMTEPGMIGKIGMNNYGIGVCLNFLDSLTTLDQIPIHLVLRTLLECKSFKEVNKKLKKIKPGQAGNILVGTGDGNYLDIEFSGKSLRYLDNNSHYFVHTNHFLSNDGLNKSPRDLASSYERYSQASKLVNQIKMQSTSLMKSILLDKTNNELPICRNYIQGQIMQDVGTVCTIIMDFENKRMEITKGSPYENDFELVYV